MLSCKKHSKVFDIESLSMSTIVDNRGEANIIIDESKTDFCDDDYCLTELFITTLTLRCYYCQNGFLRSVSSTNKFVCISCGKMIPDLSFVVQSIMDKEHDFESCHDRFQNNEEKLPHLERMQHNFNQLEKLLSAYDIRLITYALKMARAFHSINQLNNSIYYCQYALRILSFYCLDFVLDNEREKFYKIWIELQLLHDEHLKVQEQDENYRLYLENFQRFKSKLNDKDSITNEPIINESLTGDADDQKK